MVTYKYPAVLQYFIVALPLLLHFAFMVPLGTGIFHFLGIFEHTFTALHVEIGYVTVPFSHLGFRQHLGSAAATLRTGSANGVPFFSHA
jgi:hypothetical protein